MSWPINARSRIAAGFAAAVLASALAGGAAARRGSSEGPDYPRIFGSAYANARAFVDRNAAATGAFETAGIPPAQAWAIVFPELIRWSALADAIQTSNLQALYVQFGTKYADFSVGRFQMKPSFAETLEADFNRLLSAAERRAVRGGPFPAGNTVEIRRDRVRRLTDLDGQVVYLIAFFRVMERLYPAERWASDDDKVRFHAAAYNSGYKGGAARIRREAGRSRFHLGLLPDRPFYCYADIAADFLRRAAGSAPMSVR